MTEVTDVGSISEDGHWIWDGHQWQAYEKTEPTIAAPAMSTNQEFIQSTEKEFETVDQNKDGVIDKEEYIAKIMEDTLKKKEAEKAPDQIMKIMTVFILIFASCTGFVSQKVSSIEAEAAEYEADAELTLADARATEASENQLLLREEILLTEAQNLAVEIESIESQITTQNLIYNSSLDEYFKPAVEIELLEFILNGPDFITNSDSSIFNPIYYCMYSHYYTTSNCEMENYSSLDGVFDYSVITYTIPDELDDYEVYVKNAFGTLYNITKQSTNVEITSIISDYYDNNQTYYFQIPVYNIGAPSIFGLSFSGLEMLLVETEYFAADLEVSLSYSEYNISFIENNLAVHYANWNYHTGMTNYYDLLAESYFQQGLFDLANDSYNESNRQKQSATAQVQQINQNNSFHIENLSNSDSLRNEIQAAKQDLKDLEKRVNNVEDRIDILNPKLDTQDEKRMNANYELSDLKSALNSTMELKLDILDRSVAFQNGSVSSETGEFKSNLMQEEFTDAIRAESQSKYNSAEDDQQEAQNLKENLSSVASSILFISIANMLLGIAGGFSKNKQNKRNALILLIAGASCGVIGTSQIIPLL